MLKRGGYGQDFFARLGFLSKLPKKSPNKQRIWIHAVSVGELLAIEPLLNNFIEKRNLEIILTCTSSTGLKIAREKYASKILHVTPFPVDFWPVASRTWAAFQPDLSLLTEGEVWPEHLQQAAKRNVPTIVINARLSDRTYSRFLKLKFIVKPIYNKLTKILASNNQDQDRFLSLGIDKEKIVLTGNIKCDLNFTNTLPIENIDALIREMGFSTSNTSKPKILLGSSTWPGEEETLLHILSDLREKGTDCRLLLVPRHAERSGEIITILNKYPFPYHQRSIEKQAPADNIVYLADTTGELATLSQVADIAFIGKSLAPKTGGQTPIECAAIGIPMTFGPNMSNFRTISESLVNSGAALRSNDKSELKENIYSLLNSQAKRESLSAHAKNWHKENQGATQKTLEQIYAYL